jgi:signal transduction histidine kinase
VLTTKVVMRNPQGTATGLVGINRDITARKHAEVQLRQLNEDLARSQRELVTTYEDLRASNDQLKAAQQKLVEAAKMESVGRLATGVAHEVKNPLAILLMGVQYLGDTLTKQPDDVMMTLAQMTDAVKRADGIVRGLLDFSASHQLTLVESGVPAALEQALLLVGHELRQRHVQVVRHFTPNLPRLSMDRPKIEQVFVNLYLNAAQAMPAGGQLILHTALSTAPDGTRQVVVHVDDTGPGIPAEVMAKIFDPFFTTKPTGQGTGLGLTVARNIIELHHGSLTLANRPKGGARATVTFNLQPGGP